MSPFQMHAEVVSSGEGAAALRLLASENRLQLPAVGSVLGPVVTQ